MQIPPAAQSRFNGSLYRGYDSQVKFSVSDLIPTCKQGAPMALGNADGANGSER